MQLKNDIEIFDQYQKGTLSEVERADFEAQLMTDNSFKAAFDDYQMMVKGIQYAERQRLKQELLHSKPAPNRNNIRSIARHWGRMGVAASLAILVSFGIYFSSANERIYAEFDLGRHDNTMSINEMEASTSSQLFDEAMELKQGGAFQKALSTLEKIDQNDFNKYFLAQYNQALILIKLKQEDKAKEVLSELIATPGNHYTKAKAKKILKKLDHPFLSLFDNF